MVALAFSDGTMSMTVRYTSATNILTIHAGEILGRRCLDIPIIRLTAVRRGGADRELSVGTT